MQSGKIDEHLFGDRITYNTTPQDIIFCGKTYKAMRIFIDGIDVVQRIADLATKNIKVAVGE